MQAWLHYRAWADWCYRGGDFDCDYFDKDAPVRVLELAEWQPFGGETLYEVVQDSYAARAFIPLRFISLEFIDNCIGL